MSNIIIYRMPVFNTPFRSKFRKFRRGGYRYRKRNPFTKAVKSIVKRNTELKHTNIYADDTAIPATGLLINLANVITKGTEASNRVGDRIQMDAVYGKYVLSAHTSSTQTTVRVMIVMDKQSNAGTPTSSDLLEAGPASGSYINSPIKNGAYLRYRVLLDKRYALDKQNHPVLCNKFFKRVNRQIQYMYGDADPMTNNIFMLLWSNEATNTPYVNYYIRSRFSDA